MRGGPGLVLEVIAGVNLAIPSNRTPAGLYVLVSTSYGQWNTAIKAPMADCSVSWNETLTIHASPLKFPRWLMPIFSRELVGVFETTLERLLGSDGWPISISTVDNQRISLELRARCSQTTQMANHAVGGNEQSEIGRSTDAARDAYILFGTSSLASDLDNSIRGFQSVLDQCPLNHPGRAAALSNLAHAVLRGNAKNVRTDIDHGISLFRSALDLRPPGHPDHLLSNLDLCQALQCRYLHQQAHADLCEATDLSRYVLPLCVEGSYLHQVVLDTNKLHASQISSGQHSERHYDQRSVVQSSEIPEFEQKRSPPQLSPPASLSNAEQTHVRGRNVVIFGETGVGKSSIINTLAQQGLAETSNDASGCTSSSDRYPVEISGQRFVMFDTAGLNEGTEGTVPAAMAEKQLKKLLLELMSPESDGIGLLVYCVRSTSAPRALARAYNMFYAGICQKRVPIVVIITALEKETRIENWWDTNREKFESHGMQFAGHAYVTALQEYPGIPDISTRRIEESSEILRNLVVNNCLDGAPTTTGSSVLRKRGAPRPRRGRRTE
ncbi:hypothetical protein DFJ58DRAFT_796765 [Suillus subalutaceus]|uniref:uncharacterized protein n=1 Tax=Suillus subalutaceus TaxID=48586 RepID=UPI001B85F1E9|nr:uncharacterized protein DFJ58DRAFT_796765 [Suillus subalutaceus]KAG1848073.1 hypothetical protein DFJ58DRAFT_796765 [Suillus subalutaceus]